VKAKEAPTQLAYAAVMQALAPISLILSPGSNLMVACMAV